MGIHKWTEQEKKYLKRIHKGKYTKDIVTLMNKKFEYQFTVNQIRSALKRYGLNTGVDCRFKKGDIPFNKGKKHNAGVATQFKKGHKLNSLPIGTEYIDRDGYMVIKIAEHKWVFKHRYIYEQHYGEIDKSDSIIFADRNKLNFDINNLIKISKSELLYMNQNKLIFEDQEITKAGVTLAKINKEIRERMKNE